MIRHSTSILAKVSQLFILPTPVWAVLHALNLCCHGMPRLACQMKPNWSGVNLLNSTEKNRKKHFDLLSKPEFDYSLATVWLHALSMVGYIYTFWFNLVFIRLILGCGICGFFFLWLSTSCSQVITKKSLFEAFLIQNGYWVSNDFVLVKILSFWIK